MTFAVEGKCGDKIKWEFDGMVLKIIYTGNDFKTAAMDNYDMQKNQAPWLAKGLANKIKTITISRGISRIGSFAFSKCSSATSVQIEGDDLVSIGDGAFYGCLRLLNFYFPKSVEQIERIAFAKCERLTSIEIPENCRVGEYAFMSCTNVTSINVPKSASLGDNAFISEVVVDDEKRYAVYSGEIVDLPTWINAGNCKKYGIGQKAFEKYYALTHHDVASSGTGSNVNPNVDPANLSDVDENVPESGNRITNTFVVIFGNEKYYQESSVTNAATDARSFNAYCTKTLGIPSQNIRMQINATKGQMQHELDWISDVCKKFADDDNKVNLMVYYAGHGLPNEKTKDAFLLPVDGYGSNTETGIPLKNVYAQLSELPADRVTVFLDACFSGTQRDGSMINGDQRSVVVRPKEETLSGNMIVFSAAQGDETAQSYNDQGHGMFTYFLLKKLQETEGSVSYGVLSDYIKKQVGQTSVLQGKSQTPTTSTSESMKNSWRNLHF